MPMIYYNNIVSHNIIMYTARLPGALTHRLDNYSSRWKKIILCACTYIFSSESTMYINVDELCSTHSIFISNVIY